MKNRGKRKQTGKQTEKNRDRNRNKNTSSRKEKVKKESITSTTLLFQKKNKISLKRIKLKLPVLASTHNRI